MSEVMEPVVILHKMEPDNTLLQVVNGDNREQNGITEQETAKINEPSLTSDTEREAQDSQRNSEYESRDDQNNALDDNIQPSAPELLPTTAKRMMDSSEEELAEEEQENRFNEMKRLKLEEEEDDEVTEEKNDLNSSCTKEEETGDLTCSTQPAPSQNDPSKSDSGADDELHTPPSADDHDQLNAQRNGDQKPSSETDSGQGSTPITSLEDPPNIYPLIRLRNSTFKVSKIMGHNDIVNAVGNFKQQIVSASRDTTIKVWDVGTREELSNFAGHTGSVKCLLVLNEHNSCILSFCLGLKNVGLLVLSGSEDCSLRIWSLSKGTELKCIYIFTSVTSLGFDDGTYYAYVGTSGGKLELWNLIEGVSKDSLVVSEEAITCIKTYSHYVFAGSKNQLCGYKLKNGKLELYFSFSDSEWQDVEKPLCLTSCSFVLQFDRLYLGHHGNILVVEWKKLHDTGRISWLNNATESTSATTALAVKDDILIAGVYEQRKSRNFINMFYLPGSRYIGSLLLDDLHHVLCLDIIRNDDHTLQFTSGGTELLLWTIVPLRTMLESNKEEAVHDVTYIPNLEESRSNTSETSSKFILSCSASSDNSRWRCSIS